MSSIFPMFYIIVIAIEHGISYDFFLFFSFFLTFPGMIISPTLKQKLLLKNDDENFLTSHLCPWVNAPCCLTLQLIQVLQHGKSCLSSLNLMVKLCFEWEFVILLIVTVLVNQLEIIVHLKKPRFPNWLIIFYFDISANSCFPFEIAWL